MTIYAPQSSDPKAPLWARVGSHRAGALDTLAAAVDSHWPHRDHTSDGFIGDARHVLEGSGSDHNPWLNNTVRAGDFDVDGIDAGWFAEQLRVLGAAGDKRLAGGGYVIHNGRITSPDFSRWEPYTGGDPHVTHVHVSLTRNRAGYEDNRSEWPFLSVVTPQPPHPPHTVDNGDVHWTGHDATGSGDSFRAELGDEGPEVAHMQQGLHDQFPQYAGGLVVDGEYGHATEAAVREFDHRAGLEHGAPAGDRAALEGADGENVGPAGARAMHRHHLI